MDALLTDLGEGDWHRPALRDLSVQELVGHLIAVEEAFLDGLYGLAEPLGGAMHVSSTQASAKAQSRRPPVATHADWRDRTARALGACTERDAALEANYYGIVLPLDQLLVVRGFEIWAHHEDIRRACGRPLQAPDDAVLARMAHLAAALLPVGLARAGSARQEATVRLVLTGAAGGTWDIPWGGPAAEGTGRPAPGTVVVVDGANFCRVVANREDIAGSGAVVLGEVGPAERAVFVLREVFEAPYEEIAEVVGKTVGAVRQIAHRAREHVAARRPRARVDRAQQQAAVDKLMVAISTGDVQGLVEVLAPDVVLIADGGGVVAAARMPIAGADKVLAFLARAVKFPGFVATTTWLNALPGVRIDVGGEPTAVSLEVEDGRITRIFAVRNPQKLRWLDKVAELRR
jgi:uncharacterized protein (TIGR03083 family)